MIAMTRSVSLIGCLVDPTSEQTNVGDRSDKLEHESTRSLDTLATTMFQKTYVVGDGARGTRSRRRGIGQRVANEELPLRCTESGSSANAWAHPAGA